MLIKGGHISNRSMSRYVFFAQIVRMVKIYSTLCTHRAITSFKQNVVARVSPKLFLSYLRGIKGAKSARDVVKSHFVFRRPASYKYKQNRSISRTKDSHFLTKFPLNEKLKLNFRSFAKKHVHEMFSQETRRVQRRFY